MSKRPTVDVVLEGRDDVDRFRTSYVIDVPRGALAGVTRKPDGGGFSTRVGSAWGFLARGRDEWTLELSAGDVADVEIDVHEHRDKVAFVEVDGVDWSQRVLGHAPVGASEISVSVDRRTITGPPDEAVTFADLADLFGP